MHRLKHRTWRARLFTKRNTPNICILAQFMWGHSYGGSTRTSEMAASELIPPSSTSTTFLGFCLFQLQLACTRIWSCPNNQHRVASLLYQLCVEVLSSATKCDYLVGQTSAYFACPGGAGDDGEDDTQQWKWLY